jgi:hypothetical protein
MNENFIENHERDGYQTVTWMLNCFVRLDEKSISKQNKFRLVAWQSLNREEKAQVVHAWKKADVQEMENESGPVGTIAVMFETNQNGQDGFIVVYIDQKSYKVTGTESFH